MIGWKVWYSDGMMITSRTNKWIHIPIMNMQILKKFYADKKPEIIQGVDLFCIATDPEEMKQLIKEDCRNIKIGELLYNGHFFALCDLAKLDPEIVDVIV